MSLGDLLGIVFFIYLFTVAILTFRLYIRSGKLDSFWELYDIKKTLSLVKGLKSMKWDASEFPNMDPNDPIFKFVLFSQKKN